MHSRAQQPVPENAAGYDLWQDAEIFVLTECGQAGYKRNRRSEEFQFGDWWILRRGQVRGRHSRHTAAEQEKFSVQNLFG